MHTVETWRLAGAGSGKKHPEWVPAASHWADAARGYGKEKKENVERLYFWNDVAEHSFKIVFVFAYPWRYWFG